LIDLGDTVAVDAAHVALFESVTACKLIVIWLRITGRSRARVERDDVHPHSSLRKRWSVEFRKSRRGGILEVVRKRGFETPLGCPNSLLETSVSRTSRRHIAVAQIRRMRTVVCRPRRRSTQRCGWAFLSFRWSHW
jgi:hypothetical protein